MKSRLPRCIQQQLPRDWRAPQYQIANPYSSPSHYFPQPTNRIDSSSPSPPCYCSHLTNAGTAVWTILCLLPRCAVNAQFLSIKKRPIFSVRGEASSVSGAWVCRALLAAASFRWHRSCSAVVLLVAAGRATGQQNGIVRVIMFPRPLTKTNSNTVM